MNLLIVTIDDEDTYINHEKMYEYYFNNYKNYLILDKENFKVPKSLFSNNYYLKNNFSYPLTEEEFKNIKTKIIVNDKDNNNVLGTVIISLNNKVIHEEKIYSKEKSKKSESLFKKIINFFKNIFT